jgi:hypothetical protein
MRRSAALLFLILLAAGTVAARAQAVAAATTRQLSVTAGGMASVFQPDYAGYWGATGYPTPEAGPQALFGVGAYVDVKLSRWVQLEAEGRWMRFNKYYGISQDNYLVGPRLPVYRIWKATAYAKALGGYSKMTFDPSGNHGKFTTVAFGGGADVKLSKRLSLRLIDVEYQYYPKWGNTSLSPYGASMGIGYKIF